MSFAETNRAARSPLFAGITALHWTAVSGDRTGWLTWQDSNRQIPFPEMAYEFSAEFVGHFAKIGSGD
jgi:hypothetical protein